MPQLRKPISSRAQGSDTGPASGAAPPPQRGGGEERLSDTELGELYAEYGHLVLRWARRSLGSESLAREALQDVFERAWRFGRGMRGESRSAWLRTVTRNCCLDIIKHQRRALQLFASDDTKVAEELAPPPPSAERDAFERLLDALLVELASDDRHLLELVRAGFTQQEIADQLGVSRVTANKRVQKLKARVQVIKAERDALNRLLDAPLAELDVQDRLVLELVDEGLSEQQIGDQLGVARATVAKRLQKLKARARAFQEVAE